MRRGRGRGKGGKLGGFIGVASVGCSGLACHCAVTGNYPGTDSDWRHMTVAQHGDTVQHRLAKRAPHHDERKKVSCQAEKKKLYVLIWSSRQPTEDLLNTVFTVKVSNRGVQPPSLILDSFYWVRYFPKWLPIPATTMPWGYRPPPRKSRSRRLIESSLSRRILV